jgi:hypothetical protein
MPGVNPLNVGANLLALQAAPGVISVGATFLAPTSTGVQNTSSEPPLACYVFAACVGGAGASGSAPGGPAPTLRLKFHQGRLTRAGKRVVHVHVSVREGNSFYPVKGSWIKLAGHIGHTDRHGNATLILRLARKHTYRITATLKGCNPAVRKIRGR